MGHLINREKVIKGLQAHADGCGYRSHHCDAMDCPYRYGDESCDIEEMCRDALELLKEQEAKEQLSDAVHETAKQFRQTIVRCKDCIHRGKIEKCVLAAISKEKDYPLFMLDNRGDWFCADGERKEGDG